jgi:hypothetical protein
MLTIFLLPAAAILYTIAVASINTSTRMSGTYYYNRSWPWIAAALITWPFIGIYWILLWRRAVKWTSARIWCTLLAAAGAVIVGGIAGLSTRFIDDEFSYFVFSSVTPLVWLPVTVLIWRESALERAARLGGLGSTVTCPMCGYNLKGLKTTQCPECGTTFALDELLERQPGRELSELHR